MLNSIQHSSHSVNIKEGVEWWKGSKEFQIQDESAHQDKIYLNSLCGIHQAYSTSNLAPHIFFKKEECVDTMLHQLKRC